MNTRTKIWSDGWGNAEEWSWNGQTVLRFRTRVSDTWRYFVGHFTTDHCRYAVARDRAMTQDEIATFKVARSIRAAA